MMFRDHIGRYGILRSAFGVIVAAIVLWHVDAAAQGLSDGRAIVQVNGRNLAFPRDVSDYVTFNEWSFERKFSLKQVLDSDGQVLSQLRGERAIIVTMSPKNDARGLFLNKWPRSDFVSGGNDLRFSIVIGRDAQGGCRSWRRDFDRHRATIPASADGGWFEIVQQDLTLFIRRESSPDLPDHFSSLSCGRLNNCSTTVCVGNDASFTYAFSRKAFPKETWPLLVERAAAVYKYVVDYQR